MIIKEQQNLIKILSSNLTISKLTRRSLTFQKLKRVRDFLPRPAKILNETRKTKISSLNRKQKTRIEAKFEVFLEVATSLVVHRIEEICCIAFDVRFTSFSSLSYANATLIFSLSHRMCLDGKKSLHHIIYVVETLNFIQTLFSQTQNSVNTNAWQFFISFSNRCRRKSVVCRLSVAIKFMLHHHRFLFSDLLT